MPRSRAQRAPMIRIYVWRHGAEEPETLERPRTLTPTCSRRCAWAAPSACRSALLGSGFFTPRKSGRLPPWKGRPGLTRLWYGCRIEGKPAPTSPTPLPYYALRRSASPFFFIGRVPARARAREWELCSEPRSRVPCRRLVSSGSRSSRPMPDTEPLDRADLVTSFGTRERVADRRLRRLPT